MKVTGIGFVGVRTAQFDEMERFFRDVMGMDFVQRERRLAGTSRLMAQRYKSSGRRMPSTTSSLPAPWLGFG